MSGAVPDDDDKTVVRPVPRSAPTPLTDDNEATVLRTAQADRPTQPMAKPENSSALPLGSRLGEFEVQGVLGEGGFGIVYLAYDHSLRRRVALKEYMPAALAGRGAGAHVTIRSDRHRETFEIGLKSFINEARLLAQFDHPSLVKVYRFWEANGTAYMVMPYYEGTTLKAKLKEFGQPPSEEWLMGLLAPLTEALAVIHREHCFHRDIAPDNVILLSGSGRPLLLDFGAARQVISDMTQALTVILKAGYAPIEQYAEVPGMKQGPWTDLYALGAVVYSAIHGRTPSASVGRLMSDDLTPLAETARGRYSDRFLRAIDHTLRVRPEDRPASVLAFRSELGLTPLTLESQETLPAPLDSVFQISELPQAAAVPPPLAPGSARVDNLKAKGSSGPILAGGIGAAVLVLGGIFAFFALVPGKKSASEGKVEISAQQANDETPAATPLVQAPPLPGTAPAAAPAPPPPFSVDHELDRLVNGASPAIQVRAVPVKQSVSIARSESISFKVSSSEPGFLYVLVHGPDGSLLQFFPNSKDGKNDIAPGQTLTLPRPSWALQASDPPGQEHFVVMVSRATRDFSSFGNKRSLYFLQVPTDALAAELAAHHSGPSSFLAGTARCVDAGCEVYGAARFSINVVP